jgi:hypothetical protein
MFPPALLAPADAIAEYRQVVQGPHEWMVHRFSVPATELGAQILETFEDEPIAVIGRRSDRWDDDREADATAMNLYLESGGHIQSYECNLPNDDNVEGALKALRGFHAADEVLVELDPKKPFPVILDMLADADAFGAKLRTGPNPPPASTVATFIWECVALELPFKITAGLHEPLSHDDHFGFVNVLAATALALAGDLTSSQIEMVLRSDSSSDWQWNDEELCFREFCATRDDIADAKALFASFGSCSVEEPVEGLQRLGWY